MPKGRTCAPALQVLRLQLCVYKASTNAQRTCLPGRPDWELCGRIVSDDLIATKKEAAELLKMMKKVFVRSTVTVGPTIADINSGLLKRQQRRAKALCRRRPCLLHLEGI
jgi:hypothetical protein